MYNFNKNVDKKLIFKNCILYEFKRQNKDETRQNKRKFVKLRFSLEIFELIFPLKFG